MLPTRQRRNLSITDKKENSVPARGLLAEDKKERSLGALPLRLKLAIKEEGKAKSATRAEQGRKTATGRSKLSVAVMDALLSAEPSKASYNILTHKQSLPEKTAFGWKTERTSKEYSIKKNAQDWIHLKERLNQQKAAELSDMEGLSTPGRSAQDRKLRIAEFLANISKIGHDAQYWLGEGSSLSSPDMKDLIRCIKDQGIDKKRQSVYGQERGRASILQKDLWKK